jgi:hypothetical protein
LEEYVSKLVSNDYLKVGDLQKILNAPGANCTVTQSAATPPGASLGGTASALKVYLVKDVDASNTLFAATSNFVYNTDLSSTAAPYGDKGFVVIRKGGDAATFKKNQAKAGSAANSAQTYQAAVGKLPQDLDGTLGTESGKVIKYPAQ